MNTIEYLSEKKEKKKVNIMTLKNTSLGGVINRRNH